MGRKGRNWDVLVAEGREAVRREGAAGWKLGDLALEVEPMGRQGAVSGAHSRIQDYAEALDVPSGRVRTYRMLASAWPPEHRSALAGIGAHQALMGDPDRWKTMRKLEATAMAEHRHVRFKDALAARGKMRQPTRTVDVSAHERRPPGTVIPLNVVATPRSRRTFLEGLSTKLIGELIDDAWEVLEERTKTKLRAA